MFTLKIQISNIPSAESVHIQSNDITGEELLTEIDDLHGIKSKDYQQFIKLSNGQQIALDLNRKWSDQTQDINAVLLLQKIQAQPLQQPDQINKLPGFQMLQPGQMYQQQPPFMQPIPGNQQIPFINIQNQQYIPQNNQYQFNPNMFQQQPPQQFQLPQQFNLGQQNLVNQQNQQNIQQAVYHNLNQLNQFQPPQGNAVPNLPQGNQTLGHAVKFNQTLNQESRYKQKIEELTRENQELNNKYEALNNKFRDANNDLKQCLSEKAEFQENNENYQTICSKKEKDQQKKIERLEQQLQSSTQDFNQQKDELQKDIDQLNFQLRQRTMSINIAQKPNNVEVFQQYQKETEDRYQNKIYQLSSEISDLKQRLQQFQQKEQEYLYAQEQQNKQYNNNTQSEVERLKKQLAEFDQKYRYSQEKIKELIFNVEQEQRLKEQKENQVRQLKRQIEDQKEQIDQLNLKVESNEQIIIVYKEYSTKNQPIQAVENNIQQITAELNQRLEQKKLEEQKRREYEQEQQFAKDQQRIQIEQDKKKIILEERRRKGMKLKEAILSVQGVLQIGLLIDVTGSMDQYKQQTINIVDKAIQCIKDQTNRNCEFGTVCYQDFADLKQRGEYEWLNFTKNQKEIKDFLSKVNCDGGDDCAEDLRGGIIQMTNTLKWDKPFKIALLICDAPNHGSKWAGKCLDDYPNEDLSDALQKLIDNKIILIAIEFLDQTDVMFQQMRSFYASKQKDNLLITLQLKNKKPDEIQQGLIKIITEASVSATEVNNKGTKTKQEAEQRQKARGDLNKDGALEALVKKLPNPTQFDKDQNIQIIETSFDVYRVEIKQQAFEQNVEDPTLINIPGDYQITHENKWDCIRTLKPFAFGQLKAVFLMKKKNQQFSNELYVIKMPIGDSTYKSLNEALLECRSHLICQRLMQQFVKKLKEANNPKNQKIHDLRYSDFLILKEHETSYWIAERFFQGEFIKYNNNYGYINEAQTTMNYQAQAFSYFTYFNSGYNYIVNDVQGVDTNFTDPAINTTKGKFDETDMGQEGIGQYIVSFEGMKQNKEKVEYYLKMLEIDYENQGNQQQQY